MRQSIANPSARAEVRQWPLDPSIAHLVILDVGMQPTSSTIEEWVRTAFASPTITRVRTNALFPATAQRFLDAGFGEADRLALLERAIHRTPESPPPNGLVTTRMRSRDLDVAAAIDGASFPEGWRHDAESLRSITTATPSTRLRLVAPGTGRLVRRSAPPIGFAITGCAGRDGYLQRLAVHPSARRNGAARTLVTDALNWLTRRGAHRAMVNTGTANTAALDLYQRAGFDRRDDELVVAELVRSS